MDQEIGGIKKELMVLYTSSREKGTWDETFIKEISPVGMHINTKEYLPTDEFITFLISVPSQPHAWIELYGKVIEYSELKTIYDQPVAHMHVARIKFVGLKNEHNKVIEEYVKWYSSKKEEEK